MRAIISHVRKIQRTPEAQHSVWMLGGQFLVSVMAFILTYILANYVSKEVVGEYRFILAAYGTISVFALYGMSTALMQSVAAGSLGSIYYAVKTKLKYGLIGSLLFSGLAVYYYFTTPESALVWGLLLCALLLPPLEAYGLYGSYLQGASAFKLSAIFLSADRIFTTAVIAISVYFSPTLIPIVGAYLLSHGLMVFILYYLSLKKIPPNTEYDDSLLPYAKHVTAMSLIGAVTAQLDKYILFFFFGPVPLAMYWIASVLPQEVARVVSVIAGTFFPRYVSADSKTLLYTVRKLYWYSSAILGMVCVTYYFLAPFIFSIFLPQYIDADGISVVLMFGFGFMPHYLVWQIFSAKKQVKSLYYLSIGEPVLVMVLYLLLIPVYGIWGIAGALVIKVAVMNLLAIWYLYFRKAIL